MAQAGSFRIRSELGSCLLVGPGCGYDKADAKAVSMVPEITKSAHGGRQCVPYFVLRMCSVRVSLEISVQRSVQGIARFRSARDECNAQCTLHVPWPGVGDIPS